MQYNITTQGNAPYELVYRGPKAFVRMFMISSLNWGIYENYMAGST